VRSGRWGVRSDELGGVVGAQAEVEVESVAGGVYVQLWLFACGICACL